MFEGIFSVAPHLLHVNRLKIEVACTVCVKSCKSSEVTKIQMHVLGILEEYWTEYRTSCVGVY